MKTLREVYEELGVSRTTLQGWLYDILDWPKQNEKDNTALVISDEELAKIWQIRFYKQLKYSSSKIKTILNDLNFDIAKSLELQISELAQQKDELENLIKVASFMKETGVTPTSIRFIIGDVTGFRYKNSISILSKLSDHFSNNQTSKNTPSISDEDADDIVSAIERIMAAYSSNIEHSHPTVQKEIDFIHIKLSKTISESILMFSSSLSGLYPGTETGRELDKDYGSGSSLYLSQAVNHYCETHAHNDFDQDFHIPLKRILQKMRKGAPPDAPEIKNELKRLHSFYEKVSSFTSQNSISLLKDFGEIAGSEEYIQLFDSKDSATFISIAIKTYIEAL